MSPRTFRRWLLIGLLTFAFIGVVSIFRLLTSTSGSSLWSRAERTPKPIKWAPPVDIPFLEEPTERVQYIDLGTWNKVVCWPSVGGIIINTHVTSVELDFLKLPRFESSPRSFNATEEDDFCRQLRKTGAKWWLAHQEWEQAEEARNRGRSAKEREALILGWPTGGGVWVHRAYDWYDFGAIEGIWRFTNAHTMDERCKAMELSGATYYANPEDCEYVKPLLEGFGEHEREDNSMYTFDNHRDWIKSECEEADVIENRRQRAAAYAN